MVDAMVDSGHGEDGVGEGGIDPVDRQGQWVDGAGDSPVNQGSTMPEWVGARHGEDLAELLEEGHVTEGYVPFDVTQIEPTVLITSMVVGRALAGTGDSEPKPVLLMRMAAACLLCDTLHDLPPIDVMLPMELVDWMLGALQQAKDGTISEHADRWMDQGLAEMLDGGANAGHVEESGVATEGKDEGVDGNG